MIKSLCIFFLKWKMIYSFSKCQFRGYIGDKMNKGPVKIEEKIEFCNFIFL